MIATPSAASRRNSPYSSSLVLASTPRSGSLTTSTRGRMAIHRPSRIFCWFPPDSVLIARAGDALTSLDDSAKSANRFLACWRRSTPNRLKSLHRVTAKLSKTDSGPNSPSWRRSRGTYRMPSRLAPL